MRLDYAASMIVRFWHWRRNTDDLFSNRRRLLKYLEASDSARYADVIKKNGLRK